MERPGKSPQFSTLFSCRRRILRFIKISRRIFHRPVKTLLALPRKARSGSRGVFFHRSTLSTTAMFFFLLEN